MQEFQKNLKVQNNDINNTKQMKDIMKIVKSFKDSSILTKGGDTQTIEIETEGQRGGFLSMLLGTLSANLLGYLLSGKGVM